MFLEGKNILIISPESWQHISVSKHQYAIYLSNFNNKVFFLNPPSNTKGIESTIQNKVFSIHYKGFLLGMRYFPKFIRKIITKRVFRQIENLSETKFDVIWSFDNSVFYDFDALPKSVFKVSHIVDLNQNFQFSRAAKNADICFGVTPEIVRKFKKYNSKSFLITHGVQKFNVFEINRNQNHRSDKIKAIYVGNLNMIHFQWDILKRLALNNPDVEFLLLGPLIIKQLNSIGRETLNLPNIILKGKVEATDLPSYLNIGDILLILYDRKYCENYATPHKVMEYLASGKTILSSYLEIFNDLKSHRLIEMSDAKTSIIQMFSQIKSNLDFYNSDRMKMKRINYAREHSYESKIEEIDRLICGVIRKNII